MVSTSELNYNKERVWCNNQYNVSDAKMALGIILSSAQQ